ncbi:hypothetical protein D9M68_400040 [compost metagenome]
MQRRQQQAAEAGELDQQAQRQPAAAVQRAADQQRDAQRGQHLEDGHQPDQLPTGLGAPAELAVVHRQPGDHAGVAAVDHSEVDRQQPRPAAAEVVLDLARRFMGHGFPRPRQAPEQQAEQRQHGPHAEPGLPVAEAGRHHRRQHRGGAAAGHQRGGIQPHRARHAAGEPALDHPRHQRLDDRHADPGQHRAGDQRHAAVQQQAPQAGGGDGQQAAGHAARFAEARTDPWQRKREEAHAQHRQHGEQRRALEAEPGGLADFRQQRADGGEDRPQVDAQADDHHQPEPADPRPLGLQGNRAAHALRACQSAYSPSSPAGRSGRNGSDCCSGGRAISR